MLSLPDDQEFYIFEALNVENGDSPKLTLSDAIKNQEWYGPMGHAYRLEALEDKYVVLRIPGSFWSGDVRQMQMISQIYLPTRIMHHASMTALSDIYSSVFDSTVENRLTKDSVRYGTWGKYLHDNDNETTSSAKRKIGSQNNSIVLGCDMLPIRIRNIPIIPTFFGAYSKGSHQYAGKTGQTDYGIIGVKLTAFVSDFCLLEVIGSYGLVGTEGRNKERGFDCDMMSHTFSLGAKASYRIPVMPMVELVPNVQVDYMCAVTPDTEMQHTTKGKTTGAQIQHRALHNTRLSPDIAVEIGNDNIKASLSAKLNRRFGGEIVSKFMGKTLSSELTPSEAATRSMEYSAGLSAKVHNQADVIAEIGKTTGGKTGTTAKVSCLIRL
jgi:outer membrane autotransporter protein